MEHLALIHQAADATDLLICLSAVLFGLCGLVGAIQVLAMLLFMYADWRNN